MQTTFARTSQVLTCTYLDFAAHNTCMHTHASTKKHTQSLIRAHSCTRVFKSCATEYLESPF